LRSLIIGLIVVFNFIFESSLFQHIAIFGVKPDISLVIITSVAVLQGKDMGIITGAASGMLQDIVFGKPIGITSFSYMIAGYVTGLNSEKIFKENLIVPVIFTAVATLIRYTFTILFHYIIHLDLSLFVYLKNAVLPELVYNCIISVFIYKGLQVLFQKKFIKEEFRIKRSR